MNDVNIFQPWLGRYLASLANLASANFFGRISVFQHSCSAHRAKRNGKNSTEDK